VLFGSELPLADWLPDDVPLEPLWLERPLVAAAGELEVLEDPAAELPELDFSEEP
jgi:hypothetical protein